MEIKKSEFVVSSPTVSKCPTDNKYEYAFIGRSNVGKSSLINMLCAHKGPSWLWICQTIKSSSKEIATNDITIYIAKRATYQPFCID